MNGARTPGPYRVYAGTLVLVDDGRAFGGTEVADCKRAQDASFIVTACNAFEDDQRRIVELAMVLRGILDDLPQKRDWLNPDLERRARDILFGLQP